MLYLFGVICSVPFSKCPPPYSADLQPNGRHVLCFRSRVSESFTKTRRGGGSSSGAAAASLLALPFQGSQLISSPLFAPVVDNWNNPTDAQLCRALQPIRGWQPSAAGTANYTSASDQRSRPDHRHGDRESDPACHQHPGNHTVANQTWTAGNVYTDARTQQHTQAMGGRHCTSTGLYTGVQYQG